MVYRLKYEKDPAKAIDAWKQNSYPYYSSHESALQSMALTQFNFIAGAEQFSVMGLLELTARSVGMVALTSGVLLILILFCSWIILKISGITFQSSFRRRIA